MEGDPRPIALLDSGVGGLSILREVRRLYPEENLLYFADQGHVPYGPRPKEEIRDFASAIVRFFLVHEAKLVVLACNAASAASLHHIRETFPGMGFVGMEPAIKPASEHTRSGIIGVLTTKATFQGELFHSLIDRYAEGLDVRVEICPDFVELVEAGELDSQKTENAARQHLEPLLAAGADQIVLGCTHFPFLTPLFEKIISGRAAIIDPSEAVAHQVGRMIHNQRNMAAGPGTTTCFTSGDRERFMILSGNLLGNELENADVHQVVWNSEGEISFQGS